MLYQNILSGWHVGSEHFVRVTRGVRTYCQDDILYQNILPGWHVGSRPSTSEHLSWPGSPGTLMTGRQEELWWLTDTDDMEKGGIKMVHRSTIHLGRKCLALQASSSEQCSSKYPKHGWATKQISPFSPLSLTATRYLSMFAAASLTMSLEPLEASVEGDGGAAGVSGTSSLAFLSSLNYNMALIWANKNKKIIRKKKKYINKKNIS